MSRGRRGGGAGGFRFDSYGGPKSESRMRTISMDVVDKYSNLSTSPLVYLHEDDTLLINTFNFMKSYIRRFKPSEFIDKRILPLELSHFDMIKNRKNVPNIYTARKRRIKSSTKTLVTSTNDIVDSVQNIQLDEEIPNQTNSPKSEPIRSSINDVNDEKDDNDQKDQLQTDDESSTQNNEIDDENENDYNFNYYDEVELGDDFSQDRFNEDDANTMNF